MANSPQEEKALPLSDSSSLVLLAATPAERLSCFKANHPSWGGSLNEAQYLNREQHLGSQKLTEGGKLAHWILSDPSLIKPNGEHAILAACETYQKVAYVARGGSVKEVTCHGIGSVFCASVFRGRGYAKRMLRELGYKLDAVQPEEKDRFSILYSDIGKQFYAQVGWKPMSSSHIQLPPIDETTYVGTRKQLALPSVKDLDSKNIDDVVCKPDCKRTMDLLKTESASEEAKGKTIVCIRPDVEHMAWHHAREDFIAGTLLGKSPIVRGAVVDNDIFDQPLRPAVVWSRVFGNTPDGNCLCVLRLAIPSYDAESRGQVVHALASLLLRAQLEAQAWNMRQGIQLWNPEDITVEAAKFLAGSEENVEIIAREEESIASIRYKAANVDQLEWCLNEKYGWC